MRREYTAFGAAVPAAFLTCLVVGTLAFFSFEKKARALNLGTGELLARPFFFFFGLKMVLFYGFFVFGTLNTIAIFWQYFFGSITIRYPVAVILLSLISGLASHFINTAVMRTQLIRD